MKKFFRFICLVLSAAVCLSIGSFITAKESEPVFEANLPSAAYVPGSNEYYGKTILKTAAQKNIYGALVNCLKNIPEEQLAVKMTVQVTLNNISLGAGESFQSYIDSLELSKIANAVWADHPEFFWFYNFRLSARKVGNTVYLPFVLECSDVYSSNAELRKDAADLRRKADQIVSTAPKDSAFEKLLYLNDWLCDNNIYNFTAAGSGKYTKANTAVSALLSGNDAAKGPVCQGYTAAYKMLCDRLGLQCIIVAGHGVKGDGSVEDHAWNYVNLSGSWYGMDITWNDSTSSSMNLLAGSTSVTNPYWSANRTFAESHRTVNSSAFPLFSAYPTLSPKGWIQNSDAVLTLREGNAQYSLTNGMLTGVKNETKLIDLISSFEDNGDFTVIDGNGRRLQANSYVGTGCTIQLWNSGKIIDSAVIIVRGDLDGDGRVLSADYMKIKKYFQNQFAISGYAFFAADTDGSGTLETTDYMRIKLFFDKKFDLYQKNIVRGAYAI